MMLLPKFFRSVLKSCIKEKKENIMKREKLLLFYREHTPKGRHHKNKFLDRTNEKEPNLHSTYVKKMVTI